jgi:hypothetical protein
MKQIEVVAAIIRMEGKIFATQRGYSDFKDWWEFHFGAECQSVKNEGDGVDVMLTLLMEKRRF